LNTAFDGACFLMANVPETNFYCWSVPFFDAEVAALFRARRSAMVTLAIRIARGPYSAITFCVIQNFRFETNTYQALVRKKNCESRIQ